MSRRTQKGNKKDLGTTENGNMAYLNLGNTGKPVLKGT